jgi:peroxiredoxin
MLPLGTTAPGFNLLDTITGKKVGLNEIKSDIATVIMFICNHCPYVKHVNQELVRLYEDYHPRGISFAAISSNDIAAYPEDSPSRMKETASEIGYQFPYLYDETQEAAKAYQAACTPDFYIFDMDLKLVYRGQLDDSRPGNGKPVTGRDIRNALNNIISGIPVNLNQVPSIGCSIKWKK